MDRLPWSVVVLGLGAFALVAFLVLKTPEIQRERAKAQDERAAEQRQIERVDTCKGLAEEARVAAQQGQDVNVVANLVARYQSCIVELGIAEAYRGPLLGAEVLQRQVKAEFSHYFGTSTEDFTKRSNTRQAWHRMSRDHHNNIRAAIGMATTEAQVEEIRAAARQWVAYAMDRVTCFLGGMGGCSRSGVSEPHNNDRAHEEYLVGVAPIVGAAEAGAWIRQRAGWPSSWIPPYDAAGPGLLAEADQKSRELAAARAAVGAKIMSSPALLNALGAGGIVYRFT